MPNFLYFQSIVQYRIDTDTNRVEIVKKFTSPIKGAKSYNKKPKKIETHKIEEIGEIELE